MTLLLVLVLDEELLDVLELTTDLPLVALALTLEDLLFLDLDESSKR